MLMYLLLNLLSCFSLYSSKFLSFFLRTPQVNFQVLPDGRKRFVLKISSIFILSSRTR